MRYLLAAFLVLLVLLAPAAAALPNAPEFTSGEAITRWIANYRLRPDPARLPAAVRALSALGALKDSESAGIYVGFVAGVLGANPSKAEELAGKMLSVAPADQWVVVRAIAYSSHPDWKLWLGNIADRMPSRRVMIDKYLDGQLQTLDGMALEKRDPTLWDKVRGYFRRSDGGKRVVEITFDKNPDLLDTLWGYYFATGSYRPIARIVTLLPWSKDRDSVDKLTMGSMAKYTLASNASRDPELLTRLKRANMHAPQHITPVLREVIEAADTMHTAPLRRDALAAIEELKRKGPGYKRDISTWGQIGQGALALGCIAAAATGQVEFGLPCVLGGAASGAALTFWNSQ